jgi:hypothetical protein
LEGYVQVAVGAPLEFISGGAKVKAFAVLTPFSAAFVSARKLGRMLVLVLALASGAAVRADSVSIHTQFNGNFGINFPFPLESSGLLVFPGPYQLTFQTAPVIQTHNFVDGIFDVSEMNYGPGGTVDVLGPNGFQLSGTFTEAISDIFFTTVSLPGFPVGSVVSFSASGTFSGLLTDGERWEGAFGVDKNLQFDDQSPMFLQMSGPVPEPQILLLLIAGIAGLGLRQKVAKTSGHSDSV